MGGGGPRPVMPIAHDGLLAGRTFAIGAHVGRWAELDGIADAFEQSLGQPTFSSTSPANHSWTGRVHGVAEALFDEAVEVDLESPILAAIPGDRMAEGRGSIVSVAASARRRSPLRARRLWRACRARRRQSPRASLASRTM